MGMLYYSTIVSLDGYIEDSDGGFDWAMPSRELHEYVNSLEAASELLLYGRKMY